MPPTGDRKCHVLYFGELVLAALSDLSQTWSAGTQVINDEKLSKGFAKVKGLGHGLASVVFPIHRPLCGGVPQNQHRAPQIDFVFFFFITRFGNIKIVPLTSGRNTVKMAA